MAGPTAEARGFNPHPPGFAAPAKSGRPKRSSASVAFCPASAEFLTVSRHLPPDSLTLGGFARQAPAGHWEALTLNFGQKPPEAADSPSPAPKKPKAK